jgi:hypothetical protein
VTQEAGKRIGVVKKEETMANVELNPLIQSIRGKVGDVVFRTSKKGKTYVSKAPKKSRKKNQ